MVIYIDILFFINFISDFVILILCDNTFLYDKKSITKKICASLVGSIYACLFVFNIPQFFYLPPIKIIFSLIICLISFYPCEFIYLLKKCALFHLISILFCGVFFTINPHFTFGASDILWIFCICVSFLISRLAFSKIKAELYSKKCKIKIKYKDKTAILTGMIDTGNSLIDPVSSRPVMIIDEKILKKLFSVSVTKNNLCEFVDSKDFRVIPYKTISNSGITYGFSPDKLIFNGKEIKNVIVAIAPAPITSDALINTKIL